MRGIYSAFQFTLYLCAFVLGVTVQYSARRWPPSERPLSLQTATAEPAVKESIRRIDDVSALPSGLAAGPSSPQRSAFVSPSQKTTVPFSCHDRPASCGFVMIHLCLSASYCTFLTSADSSPVQAEEGWWSAVLSATRLRQLVHHESPIVLLTNYAPSHIAALRRTYESRRQLPGVDAKDVLHFAGGGAQVVDSDFLTAGQGYAHATNFEGAWPENTSTVAAGVAFMQRHETPDWFHPNDERSVSGLRWLQQQRSWPFSHVVSLHDDDVGNDDDDEMVVGKDAKRRRVRVGRIKPDILVCLARKPIGTAAAHGSSTNDHPSSDGAVKTSAARTCTGSSEIDEGTLSVLRSQVVRWLYLDSDTLVQNVSVADWRFKDDDASALSSEALHRQVGGTWRHLDAVFLRGVVASSDARPDIRHPRSHLLYDAMDLLAWDHLVLVPELNSQRDLGPFLYNDLLREPIGPEGLNPSANELLPYRLYQFIFPFERQFNSGLIGFQGSNVVVHEFFQLWSQTHRETQRCRNDTVAWDQCSLPRALRLAQNLRVSSAWEAFNARDALGAGCSSILYSNSARDLKLNREHMVVIHRRRVKSFLRRLMNMVWGANFTSHHVFNVTAWAASQTHEV